jgi:hypothetical protein
LGINVYKVWVIFSQTHLVTLGPTETSDFQFEKSEIAQKRNRRTQGCQMVYFKTKIPYLGKFWKASHRMENVGIFHGHLEYFTAIRYILWSFGNVVVSWYIFPSFGILCQEKSGNPGRTFRLI